MSIPETGSWLTRFPGKPSALPQLCASLPRERSEVTDDQGETRTASFPLSESEGSGLPLGDPSMAPPEGSECWTASPVSGEKTH